MYTADFYKLFEKHPEEFSTANSFEEFCELTNKSHLKKYGAGNAFHTFKAGKRTYNALQFPYAAKFTDLFEAAFLIETNSKSKPEGAVYIGGTAGFSKHLGGTRGYSKSSADTRSHNGAKFYGSYVIPKPELIKLIGTKYGFSFEAIKREDGILITFHFNSYIGSTWVALLNIDEDMTTMFNEETKAFIENERQAAISAWGWK